MAISIKEKSTLFIQKNAWILVGVIVLLILAIILIFWLRPGKSVSNSLLQQQIESLQQENISLKNTIAGIKIVIDSKDKEIETLSRRDSILLSRLTNINSQLNQLKYKHDQNTSNIDRFGSADIKRAFSELDTY